MKLFIFAHLDDETLCSGGLIAKSPEDSVVAIACPGGLAMRRFKVERIKPLIDRQTENFRAAAKVLGLPEGHVSIGPWIKTELNTPMIEDLEIVHWVEAQVDWFLPSVVITHSPQDLHPDHRRLYGAVLAALRPWKGPHQNLMVAEQLGVTGYSEPWRPNHYEPLTVTQLNTKLAALRCYSSETDIDIRNPQTIAAQARLRGAESGFHYAEAYQIIKSYGHNL